MVNRQCKIPRGKGVGGSTLINGLRYVRGNREDFDFWETLGNRGWSYRRVLPYFKKSENTSIEDADLGYHGYFGPMHVEHNDPYTIHLRSIINANKELGFKVLDYNGRNQLGVSRAQHNSRNGRRVNAHNAYLEPIANRKNLDVLDGAFATKILINKRTKEAKGVLFSKNGRLHRINARREVILSAGSVSSPQLLMISGIGPKEHLQELEIDVIQDLAVGETLFDHPTFHGLYLNTKVKEERKSIREYTTEFLDGYGAYTFATGVQGVGFFKGTTSPKYSESPDLEMYFLPPNPGISTPKSYNNYLDETFEAFAENFNSTNSIHVQLVVLNPKSSGTIRLKSRNPFEYPLIDMNLLSDRRNEDVGVLQFGINLVLSLLRTKSLKAIGATLGKIDLPSCRQYEYLSDDYWECIIRHFSSIGHHLMGTCPMGPDPSKGAVVDTHLRVHGIKNFRVVDSSVFIKISGHTAAATMMVAEKISDVIKLQNGIRFLDKIKN